MNKIVKINPKEYGIQESKAKELEEIFSPFIGILKELEGKRNKLKGKEITTELCESAHSIRMEAVKFRTGIDKVHKQAKEESRKTGLAIDGWKNLLLNASAPIEEDTKKIEKHFEILEAERIAELQFERADMIKKFSPESESLDLGGMSVEIWDNFYAGTRASYEAKVAAEKKAEEDRLAKEKAEAAERKRIKEENERLQKEAEAREKAIKVERARVEKERKQAEEKARKEREATEEKLRKEAEAREKIEAELKKKREEEEKEVARIEAEKQAKIKADKKAAAAPDKEKLIKWIDELNLPDVQITTPECNIMAEEIMQKFMDFKKWARLHINAIN